MKENSFKVPENYFEDFSKRISDKTAVLPAEQDKVRPLPYAVPEGYFEELPIAIQNRISSTPKSPVFTRPVLALSIAAVLAITFFLFRSGDVTVTISADESPITVAELEESHLLFDLDEDLLTAAYSEQLTESSEELKVVEDYLIENELDVSLIDI
ncbi:MAG: hypothetical protein RIQ47_844 [Bacteroidota bacterium]